MSDLNLVKSGNHLIIRVGSDGDQLTLNNWFSSTRYQVDRFELADGTAYTASELLSALPVLSDVVGGDGDDNLTGYNGVDQMQGGTGNDTLSGQSGDDVLDGGTGNDTLHGGDDNDQLLGGAGNDTLNGNNGDDVLIGGAGNDQLDGGYGSDLYRFKQDIGQDTVSNYDTQADNVDVTRFEDVSYEDLWFSRSGNNLQITVAGTDDQVTVNNWYSNTNYQLDSIEVGASVLLNNQVDQLVSAMAAYSVPSGAGNVIPQDVKDGLQPVIAATWQTS